MSTKQQAVSQPLTNEMLKDAQVLVPDLNPERKLAVVSLDILQFLTSLLPKAEFWLIKSNFVARIKDTENLEQMVLCAKQEIDFHMSVNMIKTFFAPEEETKKPEVTVSPV